MYRRTRKRLTLQHTLIALTLALLPTTSADAVVDADFTWSPSEPAAGQSIQFTDTSTGNPTEWQWDFNNDGSTDSTAQNPAWTFPNPGTYPVKLIALIPPFDIDEITQNVVVVAAGEPGRLSFTQSNYSVNESIGTATITVRRTDGSSGEVSVRCDTSNGTATTPDDYTATQDTLNWPDGDTTDKICTVPINNDTLAEGNETVNLTLTNFTRASAGSPTNAVLTIIDDDNNGDLSFTSSSYTVDEGVVTASIGVRRTSGSSGEVSVRCVTSDGTATAPDDYTATQDVLTWTNGDSGTKNCTIPISDDPDEEDDETVNLTLTDFSGGAGMGSPISASLTITNNDEAGDLSFNASTYAVGEDDGTATIAVRRTGGSDGEISVHCDTSDNTATSEIPDIDYTPTMDVLTWGNGDTSNKNCLVPIIDDTSEESDEIVDLTLTNFSATAGMGDPITAILTIIDNDLSLTSRAGLIVPGFLVEAEVAEGTTTLFAVRNTSEIPIEFEISYHGHEVTNTPLHTEIETLDPQQTRTLNVRSNLADLEIVDGIARGLILIREVEEIASPNLEGDYFQLDTMNDFAGGDRLVRPTELCNLQEMRYVNFGSGADLRVLVDTPLGDMGPSVAYTAYSESGAMVAQGTLFTSDHLNVLDLAALGIEQDFGTLLFDFSNSNGGWAGARFSAFGRFSVDLESDCRDQ